MDLIEAKYNEPVTSHHPWEYARVWVIQRLIEESILKFPSEEKTIVDIGCGDIFFVKQLAAIYPGFKFIAIDHAFTDDAFKIYQEQCKGQNIIILKTVDDIIKHINRPVDIVLLLDVLEHIENDIEFLKEMQSKSFFNERTNLIITVPAFQSLFVARDTFLKHFKRYNNSTLKSVVLQSKFEVTHIGYLFFCLLPFRAMKKVIEIITLPDASKIKGIGGRKGTKFLDKLFKTILIVDTQIIFALKKIGIKLPGLSNYVICKQSV